MVASRDDYLLGCVEPVAEAIQRGTRSLDRAEAVQEQAHLVDGEVRLAVDLPIARVLKVAGDDEVGDLIPCGGGDLARIQQLDFVGGIISLDVEPVVIGPHESKFQASLIGRLEKPLLQRTFEEFHARIPVPIEQKHIDVVIRGQ